MEDAGIVRVGVEADADTRKIDEAKQKVNALIEKLSEAKTLAGEVASMVENMDVTITFTCGLLNGHLLRLFKNCFFIDFNFGSHRTHTLLWKILPPRLPNINRTRRFHHDIRKEQIHVENLPDA